MTETSDVAAHYTSGSLLGKIRAGLAELGVQAPVPADTLAPVDEFHIGGRQATVTFLDALGIGAEDRVLDLGCGLGGPARFAAQSTGARLVGIDLTQEFVDTGRALTDLCGLSDRVDLVQGSILDLPFEPGAFDAAYMIHVGMNIADKHRVASETARVLRPGGIFGIYDVMRVGSGTIDYPVPWASGPRECVLASPARYRDALTAAGFDILSEADRTSFASDFFARLADAARDAKGPPPLGLHLVMGADAPVKIRNMVTNVTRGLIAPVEIIARKPD